MPWSQPRASFCAILVLNVLAIQPTQLAAAATDQATAARIRRSSAAPPAADSAIIQLTVQTNFSSEQIVELQPVLQCICDRFLDCDACAFWSEMLTICNLKRVQQIAINLEQKGGPEWHHWLNNSNGDCGFVQCPRPRQNPPPATNAPAVKRLAWMQKCEQLTGAHLGSGLQVIPLGEPGSKTYQTISKTLGFSNGSLCNLPNYGASKHHASCGSRDQMLLHKTAIEPDERCVKFMEESCTSPERVGQPGHLEQCCSLHAFETSGFGNQVLQLAHSLRLARSHRCQVLCLPDCHAGTMDTVECGGKAMWHQIDHKNAKNKTIHLMSTFNLPMTINIPPTVTGTASKRATYAAGALCASGWRHGMKGATGWYLISPPVNITPA